MTFSAKALFDGFKQAATSRTVQVAGTVITSVFMGACSSIPDRVVDSCMKRGKAINIMGLYSAQEADEFKKDCDEGRDVALIAATPSREGGRDYLAALVAASAVASKSPEAMQHYQTQLKLRGLTHAQVMAAADKLNREAVSGVLVCKPDPTNAKKELCGYDKPAQGEILPFPDLKGTLAPSKSGIDKPEQAPPPPADSKTAAAIAAGNARTPAAEPAPGVK